MGPPASLACCPRFHPHSGRSEPDLNNPKPGGFGYNPASLSLPKGNHRARGSRICAEVEEMDSREPEDQSALFVPLFTASERRLRAFIYGMVPSQHDVDEIMQEVSIVLWKKFDNYEPGTEFIRWAYVVARYEVLMYRRKKARDRLCFSEKLLELLADEYEEEVDVLEDERKALELCLAELPEGERDLLMAAYARDMRINKLAETSGRTATSLYKRLNRLRQRLLQCVGMRLKTA